MANSPLKSLTALGNDDPKIVEIGSYRIAERFDVALASVAARKGRQRAMAKAAKAAKVPLPGPAQSASSAIL